MPTSIYIQMQGLEAGDLIELFTIDLTIFGGGIFRFCSSTNNNAVVTFQGQDYTPIDFKAEGFEVATGGSLPTPKITIGNTTKAITAAVLEYGDLVGAKISRLRTFRNFLDGEPDADPNAILPVDVYVIDRKTNHNKLYIEWELAAVIDQQGRMIPSRQVLRDSCTHRYRVWNPETETFDYTKATCPYTAANYFTDAGEGTSNPAIDKCGKKLSDCQARFGNSVTLPTRAFPAVAKVRV